MIGAGFTVSPIGYWLVGLPAVLVLGLVLEQGVVGCWIGLGPGFSTTAAGMWRRFWVATR